MMMIMMMNDDDDNNIVISIRGLRAIKVYVYISKEEHGPFSLSTLELSIKTTQNTNTE